jgi:hypothetical protein
LATVLYASHCKPTDTRWIRLTEQEREVFRSIARRVADGIPYSGYRSFRDLLRSRKRVLKDDQPEK